MNKTLLKDLLIILREYKEWHEFENRTSGYNLPEFRKWLEKKVLKECLDEVTTVSADEEPGDEF